MGDRTGHVASVPDSPRRNPWLVWLAEVMLRPTLWPYALGLLRSGGGMPWARWDAKRCGPPLFLFHNIMTYTCMLSMQHSSARKTGAEPQSVAEAIYNLLKFSTRTCAEPQSVS